MRVECTHCRELIEIAGLEAVPGGLGFTCGRCGGVSVLAPVVAGPAPPSPAPAPSPPPAPSPVSAPPPGRLPCPKCGQLVQATPENTLPGGGEACPRCGLVFDKVAKGEARLPGAPAVMPALRGRWEQLKDRLDDTEAHHAFIEACGAQEALDFAGHCYRSLTPPGQAEDPRVAALRDRVLRNAVARVQMHDAARSPASAQENKRLQGLLVALGLAFVVLLFTVGYWYLVRVGEIAQRGP